MSQKTPDYILKIISISFGFAFAFVLLEIAARVLPASDSFSQKLPLKCKTPIAFVEEVDQDCLLQRTAHSTGTYTKGKLPLLPINTFKRANDIGQFSNVDFREIEASNPKILPIISIGDSYTEALQVPNTETYHGRLNQYISKSNETAKSSAIGTSGNPLSQYLVSAMYAKKHLQSPKSIYIFSIVSNDFDESIFENKAVQYGGVFKLTNGDYSETMFINRESNFATNIRRFIFNISAFSRYFALNLDAANLAYTYPICKIAGFPCEQIKNHKANIVDSSESDDIKRFNISRKASDIFLFEISKLRSTFFERKNTVFVVDADRYPIYDKSVNESAYFKKQRNYFIKEAKEYGFTVIDMKPVFSDHYRKNKKKFEFTIDGHWNPLGHKIVSQEIAKELRLIPKFKENILNYK